MIVDTLNKFGVGTRRGKVVVMGFGRELTPDQAYNLAAYLVVMAESASIAANEEYDEASDFDVWLAAVRRSQ